MGVVKRGYSRDFTPASEKHGRYLLDKIPADLWRRVRQKCKRDGVSVRATLLRLLTEWLDGRSRGYAASVTGTVCRRTPKTSRS
jgi:hypothetical protein